jgi:pimeloyl-ACP methyl ester carboxylesterase
MTDSKAQTTSFLDRSPAGSSPARIAYNVSGDGPLIVAIPGMGEVRSSFRALRADLMTAGYRVATMDLRGHGESDATFDAYDDEAAASDLVALIEHLGGPAVVAGNSLGAAAAVLAAAQRPDLVGGLVLLGPFVRNPPISAMARISLRVAMGGPWAGRAWLAHYPKLHPTRRGPEFEAHRSEIADSLRRSGHVPAFRRTTHSSHAAAEAAAPGVRVPTLVVMGEQDPDFTDPVAEAELVGQLLDATVVTIPGAGHYPQFEFPEVTGPAVVDFLRTAVPARERHTNDAGSDEARA